MHGARSGSASCARSSTSSRATDTSASEESTSGARSVGILGGTFNPPHLGHLAIARAARDQLGLERVVLMPARIPPHKTAERDPGAQERLAMCRLAIAGEQGLSACSLEIDRPGPSFTVDTLKAIHAIQPDAELTFIVGADIARTLACWREPAEVLRLARLAVAERSGASREQALRTVGEVARRSGTAGASPRQAAEVVFIEMPPVEVSSSMVRERAALGEPLEPLVGTAVARHISALGLYGPGSGSER